MARPLRIEFEDAIYHLCARGNERQKVFRDDRDRVQFLELLERSCGRYERCRRWLLCSWQTTFIWWRKPIAGI